MTDAERRPDTCSAPYRVRFDEAAPDGLVRTSVLLRYAQDLAWYHSSARGFTRAWYAQRGLAWLARAAEVTVLGPMGVGDEFVGTTQVVGWRRVWARRRTDIVDGKGATVAWLHVDWVLLDARGAPTRVPKEFDGIFWAPETTIQLGRVALGEPSPTAERASFEARSHELDPMDHVNNAVYADWLDEQVIRAGGTDAVRAIPRTIRLEYARAVDSGATVVADVWRDGTAWSCRLTDPAGNDLLRARLEAPGIDRR
ncbi:MAG TPA: acyl-ACP thioesterase domain-containing protein [Candidatus Limnocylindrales bacterium]|nr:acyl-ACP thioesterase domain-containing protein [Candidatus Limnocylindrales bacterium]